MLCAYEMQVNTELPFPLVWRCNRSWLRMVMAAEAQRDAWRHEQGAGVSRHDRGVVAALLDIEEAGEPGHGKGAPKSTDSYHMILTNCPASSRCSLSCSCALYWAVVSTIAAYYE